VVVENVMNKNVYMEHMDVNMVNVDNMVDEDYAANESNLNMDHVVNKSNLHMNNEDVNNADVNNVREDMNEKPEKRDVVDDINPEGMHNDEKTVEMQVHEKPEKRDGPAAPASHTTIDSPLLKLRLSLGMLNFQF
jgi:hypothetical protein